MLATILAALFASFCFAVILIVGLTATAPGTTPKEQKRASLICTGALVLAAVSVVTCVAA